MFTCVIPTLWKSARIEKLVADLCDATSVGEVIVIDNNTAESRDLPFHPKLRIEPMEINIYVNPAWNIGVSMATYDDIALINDDVNFDPAFFNMFDDTKLSQFGVIGMANENYSLAADHNICITESGRHHGWGCMILVNRANYVPIPLDLLIWCGDDWLSMHKPTYELRGLKVETEMSTTTGKYFSDIQHRDYHIFNTRYKK